MQITINETNFLIDLFNEHKKILYVHMRKNGYEMDNMLNFINGYTVVTDHCTNFVVGIEMGEGYTIESGFESVIFSSYDDILTTLDKIVDKINKFMRNYSYNKWEKIGIKYAIYLARYYIENVLYGNYTDVANEDFLYISIPENDDPDSYDWDSFEYDYDI